MTPVRVVVAALFVLVLSFADHVDAEAAVDAQGCAGGVSRYGGCVWVDDGGVSGLWVRYIKAGVTAGTSGEHDTCYGQYIVAQQNPTDAYPVVIHRSADRWITVGSGISWGPTYNPNKAYKDGTKFFGYATCWHPDKQGKVTLHA